MRGARAARPVEVSHRQAVEEEKRRQAIAQASARLDTCLREERADDAARELEQARAELGAVAELSGFDQRIAALRADLAERARQREIAAENERREREAAAAASRRARSSPRRPSWRGGRRSPTPSLAPSRRSSSMRATPRRARRWRTTVPPSPTPRRGPAPGRAAAGGGEDRRVALARTGRRRGS